MPFSSVYIIESKDFSQSELAFAEKYLDISVQARVARFKFRENRNLTILGRLALAKSLEEHGFPFEVVARLGVSKCGRVTLPEEYFGSIAHTDGLVAAVSSRDCRIGIDLEHRWHDCIDTSKKVCESLSSSTLCHDCHLRWVISEAIAKVSAVPLEQVLSAHQCFKGILLNRSWYTKSAEFADDYLVCVASNVRVSNFRIVLLQPSDLIAPLQKFEPLRSTIEQIQSKPD